MRRIGTGVFSAVLLVSAAGCEKKGGAKADAGAASPAASTVVAAPASSARAPLVEVEIPELPIRAGATSKVRVEWSAPAGTAVNDDAPFRVRWNRSDGIADAPADVRATGSRAREGFTVEVTPTPGAPNAVLAGEIDLVVCDVETHAVCLPVRRRLELGFVVVKDGPVEARVTIPLPHARGG